MHQIGPLQQVQTALIICLQGYAFAEYYDIPTAQSAQRNLSGTEVAGRALRVDFADHESEPFKFNLTYSRRCSQLYFSEIEKIKAES